jgi:hypothetical protein
MQWMLPSFFFSWIAVGSNLVKEGDVSIIFISKEDRIISLSFEIFRAVNIQITIFWHVVPCSLIE